MNDEELFRLRDLAQEAALSVGAVLGAQRDVWRAVEAEEAREVKLRADHGAEALIIGKLQAASSYPILSEEIGWVGGAERDVIWAVDPLDGSVNYRQEFPHWAVSIALVVEGRPKVGVVYLPVLGEMYAGIVGVGATCNAAPIAVSEVDDPARGIIMTGIPARAATDAEAMAALQARLLRWRKVRMIGSAACALAYVGAGKADAYHETGGMLWDVAAGCAIVEAAGGVVQITADALDRPLDVRAGNGLIAL